MNRIHNNAAATEYAADEALDIIFAKAESSTMVPFSRSPEPTLAQAYQPLRPKASRIPSCEPTLSEQEVLSVCAVLAHIAYSQDVCQETLLRLVEVEFSVDTIKAIPQNQFHSVMEFLIDLRTDSMRSRLGKV